MPRIATKPVRLQPTHTQLRQAVCHYLDVQGAWFLPIIGGIGTRRGSPDVVCCLRGSFVAVEIKAGKDKLRPEQLQQRAWILRAGGIWVEVRCLEDLQEALEANRLATIGRLV